MNSQSPFLNGIYRASQQQATCRQAPHCRRLQHCRNMHTSEELDGAQPSPKRAKADSSQKMGALLLRGWTMRAESCPDCLVSRLVAKRGRVAGGIRLTVSGVECF